MNSDDIAGEIQAYNDKYTWSPRELVMEYTARASSSGQGKRYNAVTELAKDLGVSRRSVERYVTTKGAQRRSPGKATQAKLNALGKQFSTPSPGIFNLSGIVTVNGYPRDRTVKLAKFVNQAVWNRLSRQAGQDNVGGILDTLAAAYKVDSINLEDGLISIA